MSDDVLIVNYIPRQDPDTVRLPPGAVFECMVEDPDTGRYYARALIPIAFGGKVITEAVFNGSGSLQVGDSSTPRI